MNQETIDYLRMEFWLPTIPNAERGNAVIINRLLDEIEKLRDALVVLADAVEAELPQIKSGVTLPETHTDLAAALDHATRALTPGEPTRQVDLLVATLRWFATGMVGASSKAMAIAACEILPETAKRIPRDHPLDPDDFNRCLLLLEAVPAIRQRMHLVARLSKTWACLVVRWDELEATFLDEAGLGWSKGFEAPKTYRLIKEITHDAAR